MSGDSNSTDSGDGLPQTQSAAESQAGQRHADAELKKGIVLGLVSAVGYTGANLALRQMAVPDDIGWAVWVTANKAVPAAVVAWILVARQAARGEPALPPRSMLLQLILVGLLMQYGGNLMFQLSLTLGGLAISVPLCFATLITTGAWLGRVYLNDPLTPRTLLSVGILVVSIICLSIGAEEAATAMNEESSTLMVALAIATAAFSGCAYAISGVVIRHMVTTTISIPSSLVILSTTGVVAMGVHSLFSPGVDRILATTSDEWIIITAAGLSNAIAFFAVAGALKRISVTYTNVLNASQNAICALAGVMLFHEPLTLPLIAGCVLTMVGLVVIDNGKKHRTSTE